MHCIVAGYLPAGFSATGLEVNKATKDEPGNYTITYTKSKSEFIVEMASEGIGSGDPVDEEGFSYRYRKVHTALLGKTEVVIADKGSEHHWDIEWVDLGRKKVPRFVCVIGHYLSGDEGVKIVKGLTWLAHR